MNRRIFSIFSFYIISAPYFSNLVAQETINISFDSTAIDLFANRILKRFSDYADASGYKSSIIYRDSTSI